MRRWPGIRHLRWLILAWQFDRWWQAFGRRYWLVPNPADVAYLRDVWEGRA